MGQGGYIDISMVYANMLCIFFGGQFALSPNCATFAAGDALRNLVRGASVTLAARESKGTRAHAIYKTGVVVPQNI